MPNNPRAGGVSRRIEGEDRKQVREALNQVKIPNGMGAIVRTAGVGRTSDELGWDITYLEKVWKAIEHAAAEKQEPFLIYQESNAMIRALRDHYRDDINEIIIDDTKVYQDAHNFLEQVMPNDLRKLKHYEDRVPLFNRYQIEAQIESAFQREVSLPSGGAIVIDHTEALLSIDINSARATKGSDIEQTALQTNLEAADEIARQLRLRDLGGLIVVDFIDMLSNKNQREVENRLRDAIEVDRARIQIGRISRFGLLEMSRQRLRPSLGESSEIVCPRCTGHGTIRTSESLALAILRLLEEEAMKDKTGKVIARVPVEVGTFLLNEKRLPLQEIEHRHKIDLIIVPQANLETPHFEVQRVRTDDKETEGKSSYELSTQEEETIDITTTTRREVDKPAVSTISMDAPAPAAPSESKNRTPEKTQSKGLLARIFAWLFADTTEAENKNKSKKAADNQSRRGRNNNRNRNNNRRRNSNQRNQNRRGNRSNKGDQSRNDSDKQRQDNRGNNRNRSGGRNNNQRQRNQSNDQNAQQKKSQQPKPAKDQQANTQQNNTRPQNNQKENSNNGSNNQSSPQPATVSEQQSAGNNFEPKPAQVEPKPESNPASNNES